jgi:hypothetical protein
MDLFLVVREVTHLVRSRCVSAYAGTCAGRGVILFRTATISCSARSLAYRSAVPFLI